MSVWRISVNLPENIFDDSYFINIQSTINNTWINHKNTEYLSVNQVANYGVDKYFKHITQIDQQIILLAQSYYSKLVSNPYVKLNETYVVLGKCDNSSNPLSIEWDEVFSYPGSWTYIYPGFNFFFNNFSYLFIYLN